MALAECGLNLADGLMEFIRPPGLLIPDTPKSSWVAILGSLELLTIRPPEVGDGGDLPPLTAGLELSTGRGSGDKSRSDSGEEA